MSEHETGTSKENRYGVTLPGKAIEKSWYAPVDQIYTYIDDSSTAVMKVCPDISAYEFYSNLAQIFPNQINTMVYRESINGMRSKDRVQAERAGIVFTGITLRNAVNTTDHYLDAGVVSEEADDMVMSAINQVIESGPKCKVDKEFNARIYSCARRGVVEYLSSSYCVPMSWLRNEHMIGVLNNLRNRFISDAEAQELTKEASQKFGIPVNLLRDYWTFITHDYVEGTSDDVDQRLIHQDFYDDFHLSVAQLESRAQQEVLLTRFPIGSNIDSPSLQEVARHMGESAKRVFQLEKEGIGQLKHTQGFERLKEYLE